MNREAMKQLASIRLRAEIAKTIIEAYGDVYFKRRGVLSMMSGIREACRLTRQHTALMQTPASVFGKGGKVDKRRYRRIVLNDVTLIPIQMQVIEE